MSSRSFFVTNFGCRASQSEGAAIEQELLNGAAIPASSVFAADVVVVNTCTVTEEADREARQLIRRIASRNPQARVVVTGCYAQRAPEELAALPGVSHVVGNSHKPILGQLTLKVLDSDFTAEPSGRAEVFCSDIFLEHELKPESHRQSSGWMQCQLLLLHHSIGTWKKPEPSAALCYRGGRLPCRSRIQGSSAFGYPSRDIRPRLESKNFAREPD
jgi:hypothetical protein